MTLCSYPLSRIVLFVHLLVGMCGAVQAQHKLLVQGNNRLAIVDADGKIEWEMPWGPIHDVHVLPDRHILVQQGRAAIAEIDPTKKEVVWTYDSSKQNGNAGKDVETHALQPIGAGRVMIAESGPGRIIEIDRDGKLLKHIKLEVDHPHPHTDTRLVRKLAGGGYLVCHEGDGFVREYDDQGAVTWEYEVPLFGKERKDGHGPESFGNKCFCALRLPNRNTLIATGNGHSVIEVNHEKEIIWKLDQNDLPGVTLAWVTTLEVLPNGNYLIGNCHAGPGQPVVIEINPKEKRLIWQANLHAVFGNDVSNTMSLDTPSETIR